jgi:hypothetical protein
MSSVASSGPANTPGKLFSAVFTHIRRNIRVIAKTAAMLAVIIELAAIWNEIHQVRNEQVKNITYALPKERRDALRRSHASKRMESTAFVDGQVTIDGAVELDQPVEVEISR